MAILLENFDNMESNEDIQAINQGKLVFLFTFFINPKLG